MLICYYTRLIAITEGEEYWCTSKVESIAQAAFEIALIAPVEEAKVAAVNHKPWRTGIGLDHVAKFWMGVFKAGWWMASNGVHEELVEVGSFKFGVASFIDLLGQLKNFSDVFASDARGHDDWCERNEVKVIFEVIENLVAIFVVEIGLGENKNDAFAGFDDFTGEALIELRMWLGAINEEATDVGFFDGGKAAEGGKLLDAHFPLAWFAEAGGIE